MRYPGGKNGAGVYQTIINQIPPLDAFIDMFAGSGTIPRMMRPAHVTVVIDICTRSAENLKTALPGAVVINDDAISAIPEIVAKCVYTHDRIFVYADPPYIKIDIDGSPVRSSQADIYEHEFGTVEQHMQLLALLKSLDCMVMLSGYWSKLYARELAGWRTVSYNAVARSGKVKREYLWMNYPEPVALHDYSFLGTNRTDRQRIKRKAARTVRKFKNLPLLEKRVLLLALEDVK